MVRALAALLLAVGVLAPLAPTPVGAAPWRFGALDPNAAPRPGGPPPIPEPSRVVATGSFQTALGCPADDDPTCPLSALAEEAGIWSADFVLPAGSYGLRLVVSTADGDLSLGQGGDPDGADIAFDVPDDAAGVRVAYNTRRAGISVEPFAEQLVLSFASLGEIPLAPIGDGEYEAYFDAPAGASDYQVLSGGEPVGAPDAISLDASSRVRVVVDADGNVLAEELVDPASLTVAKVDEAQAPLAGACFALYQPGGSDQANQACDGDDGSEDGTTVLVFPNGVVPGAYDLVETLTPDGQTAAADQTVQLGPGDQAAVATGGGDGADQDDGTVDEEAATGDATETPTGDVAEDGAGAEDGDGATVTVTTIDAETEQPIPGACFAVEGASDEVCDDADGAADGTVTIEGVPFGAYTLSDTRPPDGYRPFGSTQIEITEDTAYRIPFEADPDAPASDDAPTADDTQGDDAPDQGDPTTTATAVPGATLGSLTIATEDEDGEPLAGAAFTVTNGAGGPFGPFVDDDGDGEVIVSEAFPGPNTIAMTGAPDGRDALPDQTVEVTAGRDSRVVFAYDADPAATAPAATGEATEAATDEAAEPDASATPATPATTTTPAVAGVTLRLLSVETFDTAATFDEQDGLEGACYQVEDETDEVCDGADGAEDGYTTFEDVPPGAYQVTETRAPDGYLDNGTFTLVLTEGGNNGFYIEHQVAPDAATADADQTATAGPATATAATPEEGEDPTIVDREADGQTGTLRVQTRASDDGTLIGACFALTPREEGDPVARCDGDDGAEDGTVVFADVPATRYRLDDTQAPDGYEPAGRRDVTVAPGTTVEETVEYDAEDAAAEATGEATGTATAAPTLGSITILAEDEGGNPLGGAAYTVTNAAGTFGPFADDDLDGDVEIIEALAGATTIRMATAPDGREPLPDETVEVEGGQEATVTFAYDQARATTTPPPAPTEAAPTEAAPTEAATPGPALGALAVTTLDADGNPVAGACYALAGDGGTEDIAEICDGDAEDGNANAGVVRFDRVVVGDYTLEQTDVPDGYQAGADQGVTVPDEGIGTATVTSDATAAPTGDLVVRKLDDAGQPLGGACFALLDPDNEDEVARACDEDGDAPDDGRIGLLDVPTGDYLLRETRTPEGFDPAPDQTVTVGEGEATVDSTATRPEPETGGVLITRQDDEGNRVGGGCYTLTPDDGGEPIGPVCDGGEGDASGSDGRVRIDDVAEGGYVVAESQTPAEVEPADEQDIAVAAEETLRVTIASDALPGFGTIRIAFRGPAPDATPLPGGCVTVANPAGSFGPFCDADFDQVDDGVLVIPQVEPGENTITETTPPVGFAPAEGDDVQTVTVEEDAEATVTIDHVAATGTVDIAVADAETDEPLGGSCVSLAGATDYGPVCDSPAPGGEPAEGGLADAAAEPGLIRLEGVLAGEYVVTQTTAPEGYDPADEATATVAVGAVAAVALENQPTPPETGAVRIDVVGTGDAALAGACFGLIPIDTDGEAAEVPPACDNGAGDADEAEGVVLIEEVAPGRYGVDVTRTPDGYVLGDGNADLVAVVEAGADEPAVVRVVFAQEEPEAGSVVVRVDGPDGAPVAGACYSLAGSEAAVCDGDAADADGAEGTVRFDDVPTGEVTVTETTPPPGVLPADPAAQTVAVAADEAVEVRFAHGAAEEAVETGGVEIRLRDEADAPLPGRCVTLTGVATTLGPVCDGGDGDASDEAGVVLLEEVPVDTYRVTAEVAEARFASVGTAGPLAVQEASAAASQVVEVRPGVVVVVIVVIIVQQPTAQDVLVAKLDERGVPLGGACFALLDGEGETAVEICDNDGDDTDGTVGRIRFDAVPVGDYSLRETSPPPGYEAGADQPVAVTGGSGAVSLSVTNQPIPDATGDLAVLKVNPAGDAVGGACFALVDPATGNEVASACDEDGEAPDDGRIGLSAVPAGTYTLRESRAPSADYAPAGSRTVTVVAGQETTVSVENRLRPGAVTVQKVGGDGAALPGSCFALQAGGATVYERCDADDGRGEDGSVAFATVAPGDYTLVETVVPPGYGGADDQAVSVAPRQRAVVTVQNTPLPPPPTVGDLRVVAVDGGGAALPGACFALLDGATTVAGPRCDAADGALDGQITLAGVAPGDYTLRETRAPSAAYQRAEDRPVGVVGDETTEVTVESLLKPGRVLVRKVNRGDQLLQGACFDLAPDGQPSQCTDAGGTVLFGGLQPGTYRLRETQAPPGYRVAAPVEDIVVNPGATTVLTVVAELAPPPPDTGSIQVVAFSCPAGSAGERTRFLDSSDPGPKQLAQTANCVEGNADLTLIRSGGEGGPGAFGTGDDGVYEVSLPAAEYVLTVTAPDLAGEARETVTVSVGQRTTVIVINDIAPPAPQPAAVNVLHYTCAPGFQGTIYADFVDNCTAPDQLTNGVAFRVVGPASDRQVTGDGGQAGATRFGQLPAGEYALQEELLAPATTVYSFCGVDANAPTLRRVGVVVGLQLGVGATLSCTFFNVPEELTDTTGAILVTKYACPVDAVPNEYAFYDECALQATGAQFSLALYNGENRQYTPKSTGTTDTDGLLRFTRLQPGTYQLKEVGNAWCYAESNNVRPNGDVVVEAGQRTEVFIFNCVGPEAPPNTGTGSAWLGRSSGLTSVSVAAVGGLTPAGLAFALAWPVLGLAAFGLTRRRRVA